MSPQLSIFVDNAMARREILVSHLARARTHGRDIEAFTIEEALGELDLLLKIITRVTTIN